MKKVLCFIGVAALGFIASRLLSWAFWLILHVLNGATLGVSILFWVLVLPLSAGIMYGVVSWASALMAKMCVYKWYKVIPALLVFWHGATCVVMPWGYMTFGGINVFTAIYMSVEAIFVFGSFVWLLSSKAFDKEGDASEKEDKPATEVNPAKGEKPHYLRDAVVKDAMQNYREASREVGQCFTKEEVKLIEKDAEAFLKELEAVKDSPILSADYRDKIKKKWDVLDNYIRKKSMLSWTADWLDDK